MTQKQNQTKFLNHMFSLSLSLEQAFSYAMIEWNMYFISALLILRN